jgi:UDP-N-acetylmuramoylalanine--D-glutamate ligase
MHPPISWSELTSTSVGLWGLGVEGTASLHRLQAMGTIPVLVDDAPGTPTLEGLEVLSTARGGLEALLRCDVVIKSPGISRYRPEVEQLEGAGIPVRGGLGLWLEEADRSQVACITGTKGKSTTTALAGHLLTRLGRRARIGGNIGHPPWEPSEEPEPDVWVIETSSFQVPDLTSGPAVVAVTSLFPDHLDWHGSEARYYADKLSLCTKPGVEVANVNGSDPTLRTHTTALGRHVRWIDADAVGNANAAPWFTALGLPGRHNRHNAAMARAVLLALGVAEAADDTRMATAAEGFGGLPSRCHSLGRVEGVEFVDDSLSTNVLPAQAALEAYDDRPVALLVGGHDRGLDYSPLGLTVAERRLPTLVVTMPDNGPRIGQAIREVTGGRIEVTDAAELGEAVTTAFEWARPDGVVLLSPAAPSFGRFTDYRTRALAFADAVGRLGELVP